MHGLSYGEPAPHIYPRKMEFLTRAGWPGDGYGGPSHQGGNQVAGGGPGVDLSAFFKFLWGQGEEGAFRGEACDLFELADSSLQAVVRTHGCPLLGDGPNGLSFIFPGGASGVDQEYLYFIRRQPVEENASCQLLFHIVRSANIWPGPEIPVKVKEFVK